MKNVTTLKEKNAWTIRSVVLLHIFIFVFTVFDSLTLFQFNWKNIVENSTPVFVLGAGTVGAIAVSTMILLGLLPSKTRDRLIHWRWHNPLPGSKAFSKIGPSDPRVNMERLEKKFGPFPTAPEDQGRLFYSIYTQYSDKLGVIDAHSRYLACRDAATISLIFVMVLPFFAFLISDDLGRIQWYTVGLVVIYICLAIPAQQYSIRFVENTLAASTAARPSGRGNDA